MKKLFKKIQIRKPFTDKEFLRTTCGFVICFTDKTYIRVDNKDELMQYLEKDNKHRIWYIFDMSDRIIIDREIQIESNDK